MAIRKIARMGHSVLMNPASLVETVDAPEVARIAQDLIETCEDINASGIAAPQIYEPIRLFVYRIRKTSMVEGASMKEIPWTVCINPEIEVLTDETQLSLERCLSLPGLFGLVPRPAKLRLRWSDTLGDRHSMVAYNHHARLLQHEYDHLDGVLYPMRMDDMSTFGFVSELGPAPALDLPRSVQDFVDPDYE